MRWLFLIFMLGSFSLRAAPIECEVLFSPRDRVGERLVALIEQEQKSIKVAMYHLYHHQIAKALIKAKQRGVLIEVLIDPFSIKTRSSTEELVKAKVPLFVWDHHLMMRGKKRQKKSVMHDAFCVFGNSLVWTGSFYFTHDATLGNQENIILIESEAIANQYHKEFAEMRLYGCRPYEEYVALHPKKKKGKKAFF